MNEIWTPNQMADAILDLLPEAGLDTAKMTEQEIEDYWKEVVDIMLGKNW